MDNDQAPAQSEQPAAPAAPENDGFQKRIDQLTAKIHERDQQLMDYQQKLLNQVLQAQAPVAAPVPEVDPLAQFNGQLDDTVMRAVRAATEAVEKKFAAESARRDVQYRAEMSALQVHERVATEGIDVPQDVRQKAVQIARQHGTTAEVALKYALGEYYMEQAKKVAPVKNYVPPNTPVLTTSAPAPQRTGPTGRPSNFESLDLIQQAKWLEANGFDDSPLG